MVGNRKTLPLIDKQSLLNFPDVIFKYGVLPFLDLQDASHFSNICKRSYSLFNKSLTDARLLQPFLRHVVRGELNQAEKMAKIQPNFLIQNGQIQDYSGRTFYNITALQYALWALDSHAVEMLINCFYLSSLMPQAILQIREFQKGIVYKQPKFSYFHSDFRQEKLKRDFFYNYNNLIAALENYISVHWAYLTGHEGSNELYIASMKLGTVQRFVPAHVAKEYCNRSFDPTPKFDKTLPPNYLISNLFGKRTYWYPIPTSGIRNFFARGAYENTGLVGVGDNSHHMLQAAQIDVVAIKALFEIRKNEIEETIQNVLNIGDDQELEKCNKEYLIYKL